MDDMLILAHIREQHRLSLRMTEELQELGISVGHWRVGRVLSADCFAIACRATDSPEW
jgi:hypothetical protein